LVIEDCAESLGSDYRGVMTGDLGDAGCFSFFGNKVITTGEGGMVVFKNRAVAERARMLRDHGMSPHKRYWHDCVGFNYRLTNLQAAIGVAQLERLPKFIEKRASLTLAYDREFGPLAPQVRPQPRSPWGRHVTWLYCLQLAENVDALARDAMIQKLSLNGIESRPVFYPLHEMPPYRALPSAARSFPVADRISRSALSLPSACTLSLEDIRYISTIIGRELRFSEMLVNCRTSTGAALA